MGKLNPLESAFKDIEKEYGAKIETAEDFVAPEPMPTGSVLLDYALGIGGIPSGRIVELFGPESSGKSSIAYMIAGSVQRAGGEVVWIDAENVHSPFWAEKQGVDVDKLRVISTVTDEKTLCMEEVLGLCEKVMKTGLVKLVIIDSVTALVPGKEFEQEMGDQNVGLQARILSQALRKLVGVASKSKACLIFINQLRDTPGKMWGNPETTPGGRALKFYASIRFDVRRLGSLGKDTDGNPYGHKMQVKCVKNKVAPPFRKGEFDLYYSTGVDRIGEIVEAGVITGVITKSGSMYAYKEGEWKGADAVRDALIADQALHDEVRAAVLEKFYPPKTA